MWAAAQWSSGFLQRDPIEGRPATQATEVALAFDDEALYVAARLHSTNPAGIRSLVTRRDVESASEQLIVSLDTYRDRRTAFSFGVTSAGVRLDYYHPADDRTQRDYSYDPVWEAATARDSSGWTAEMRIPFSQLRFDNTADLSWGINVARRVPALNEESFLVLVPKSETGWASRFAELTGLTRPPTTQRAELLPYVAASARLPSQRNPLNPFDDGRNIRQHTGVDLRLRLRSNVALEATLNPDFGEVEADPAEVNLGVFETTFPEKRPFFTEGRELLSGGGASYFYSRRIGAVPRLSASGTFVDQPTSTTILGAAKLTGRTRGGLAISALAAVTGEESARGFDTLTALMDEQIVQPRTTFAVARAQQQFGQWGSTGGAILTAVTRQVPEGGALGAAYPTRAITGGTDWNLRMKGGEYVLAFDAGFSRVTGDSSSILRLQRSSARYFQRPDAEHVEVDPGRRALSGYRARAAISKEAGRHWLWGMNAEAVSPGFELNDAGQLSTADDLSGTADLTYRENLPGGLFQNYSVNVSAFGNRSFDGVTKVAEVPSIFANATLNNFWSISAHYHWSPRTRSTTVTRGGPAMLMPDNEHVTFDLRGNPGDRVVWSLGVDQLTDEIGRRQEFHGGLAFRPAGRWQLSLSPSVTRARDQRQYVATLDGGPAATYGARYVFANIDRREVGVQLRANYSVTQDLSLELFVQPFVSIGAYHDLGEVVDPRQLELRLYGTDGTVLEKERSRYTITDGAARFTIADPDFTVRSLRGNAVMRWEWHRGSTLYVVWQQDRSARDAFAHERLAPTFEDLLHTPGEHRLAVKMSYWLSL
ncbi:MAG: DUF5916 domain-containing protein [bacterium]